MKKLYFSLLISFFYSTLYSQTITVSGQCISGTIVLSPIGDIDGLPAFEGTGTVLETPSIQVNIYWIPAPENVWVLAYDGQPYFYNSCDTDLPPGSENATCSWLPVEGTVCTGSNPLSVTGAVVLPVSLIDFTAVLKNKNVLLGWKTMGEINNKGFEIERSPDGNTWRTIGFVAGALNASLLNNYSFNDHFPMQGNNIYRLRQWDINGNFVYSVIQKVNVPHTNFYSLTCNDGKGLLYLNMISGNEKIQVKIVAVSGKTVYSKTTRMNAQTIDITGFPPGVYLLQLNRANEVFTEKIIKF